MGVWSYGDMVVTDRDYILGKLYEAVETPQEDKNMSNNSVYHKPKMVSPFEIKNVIFNEPATIVFWADGTKTVVKCQEDDEFDPEKGLTMAIAKKVYGNKGSYCNEIKKWVEPYYEDEDISTSMLETLAKFEQELNDIKERWL